MILHADADCFFASVELRRRPELVDRPMAVATHIIMSANYPARAYGVHGAMPVREAQRLCPDLALIPPADDYQAVGGELMALFERFAVQVEPGSVEEAFIDVGDRDPVQTARTIRAAARDDLGLAVTVGVGRTRLIAKLASRQAKPDGLLVIDADAERRIRAALTIDELWGVGPITANRLADRGVHRLTDLAGFDEACLRQIVGTAMARRLLAIRDGTDDARVRQLGPRRSVSASRTMMRPSAHWPEIRAHADEVIDTALQRLAACHGGQAVTHRIEIKIDYADRQSWTEHRVLGEAVRDPDLLRDACRKLIMTSGVATARRPVLLIMVTFRLTGVAGTRSQQALPLF